LIVPVFVSVFDQLYIFDLLDWRLGGLVDLVGWLAWLVAEFIE
jgi:hypothetical protein